MYKLIFHTPKFNSDQSKQIAHILKGNMQNKKGYCELLTPEIPTAEILQTLRTKLSVDVNLIPATFDQQNVRLVISDMDSTLINIECIDEIADFAGVKPQVSKITEAAMRGELNFEQSLTKRVGLLKGLDTSALQNVYEQRLKLNPGAEKMLQGLRDNNIKFALVSGGFTFFTEKLKDRLALDFALANVLEIENEKLSGSIVGAIVGAEAKKNFLLSLCSELGIRPDQTLAIGDGANDLQMLSAAGVGVAYHAKPKVQQAANCVLNHSGLEGILGLLDIEH